MRLERWAGADLGDPEKCVSRDWEGWAGPYPGVLGGVQARVHCVIDASPGRIVEGAFGVKCTRGRWSHPYIRIRTQTQHS